MASQKSLLIGLFGIVLAVGIASIAVASADLSPFGITTSTDGNVGVQDTARITSIKCCVNWGEVTDFDPNGEPTVIAHPGNLVFITVKGRCTGPSSQRGVLVISDITDPLNPKVHSAVQMIPGKEKTLKPNPPLRWTTPGTRTIMVQAVSPDGVAMDFTGITVYVLP